MLVFSGTANHPLAGKIADTLHVTLSPLEIHVFPDGEKRVQVKVHVVDKDCVVTQSTAPPVDQNYMELFFIIDALKRSGAKKVTAVIPYLGYQRQDHVFRDGEAVSLDVVIKAMESIGADAFVIFDLHSIKIPELFHESVTQLSALPLFAREIKKICARDATKFANSVLVSPDMGGIRRIKILSELLDNMPYAVIVKNRDLETGNVTSDQIEGEVNGKTAFIVDDMISSGGTIAAACELLQKKEALEMYVFATHAVFSEIAPEVLQNSHATKIFVTDTIYVPTRKLFGKLEIISVAGIIANTLSASSV